MQVFTIPYQGRYIVYRPLKRLAFFANAALVNRIAALLENDAVLPAEKDRSWYRFLDAIGFMEADPPIPQSPQDQAFAPVVAVLCMTTACNLRCVYCYADGGERTIRTLPPAFGFKAIDTVYENALAAGAGHFTVSFHGGGEPTLPFENFKKLVQYSRNKELPCRIEVTTNGYWPARKRDWMLDHVDSFSLSCDGIEALHDRQRPLANGKGTFRTVFKTIQALDARQKEYGIRLTVTDRGIAELPESIRFLCRESGCPTFQAEPAFATGRAQENEVALKHNRAFGEAFLQAYDIAQEYGRHLYYSGARPWVITDHFCGAYQKALIVTPEGALSGCYEVSGPEHPLFSRFHFGTIADGPEVKVDQTARRRYEATLRERKALCANCFCYWHCAGDCPVKTGSTADNGHLQFSGRCDLNRYVTRELLVRYLAEGDGLWQG
ncbi:MAG: radical SAM protein [Calditrichaeota bacterium]|nr:radical SAM protein [Calditrichota bacterium]